MAYEAAVSQRKAISALLLPYILTASYAVGLYAIFSVPFLQEHVKIAPEVLVWGHVLGVFALFCALMSGIDCDDESREVIFRLWARVAAFFVLASGPAASLVAAVEIILLA